MTTDLFAAVRELPPASVAAAIPPDCRRDVDGLGAARRDGDTLVVEAPAWSPRAPARHLVPALAALGAKLTAFRFEISARADGAWTPWVATATIGEAEFPRLPAEAGPLSVDVDVITADRPVDAVRVRVRAARGEGIEGAWLLTLSACDAAPLAPAAPDGGRPVALAVPPRTQMDAAPALRRRVCSPTSVAMVLDYWGVAVDVAALATEVFHAGLDIYGVWPAAIQAAAARGVAGYLLRFPGWAAAAWCLERGLPVVASVRYAAGELAGAAIGETPGHLLVLTGVEGDEVLVNDPAAPTRAEVPRRYRLADIRRAWLERAGVGYVLFRPA